MGGVLGLFGSPLLAAGGAALGAKVIGNLSDDAEKWHALMVKIETMQIYINHMKTRSPHEDEQLSLYVYGEMLNQGR